MRDLGTDNAANPDARKIDAFPDYLLSRGELPSREVVQGATGEHHAVHDLGHVGGGIPHQIPRTRKSRADAAGVGETTGEDEAHIGGTRRDGECQRR